MQPFIFKLQATQQLNARSVHVTEQSKKALAPFEGPCAIEGPSAIEGLSAIERSLSLCDRAEQEGLSAI